VISKYERERENTLCYEKPAMRRHQDKDIGG
jgi:hypothetical protein